MGITNPEISSVSDTALTLVFATADDTGAPTPADAEILVRPAEGGTRRIVPAPAADAEAESAVRLVRIGDLKPDTLYDIDIRCDGELAHPDALFFPAEFRTLRTPPGERLGTVATLSDLHFGEKVCGLGPTGDEGPIFRAADENPPYWTYMNEAVVAEINVAGVDAVVVKGDLTGDGRAEEFEFARATLARLTAPWHVVLGNHDRMQDGIDGLALLSQPGDPVRAEKAPGARLVLLDTVDAGRDGGVFPPERRDALADTLADGDATPTLVFAHHYTSDPRKRRKRSFGIHRDHSEALLDLFAAHPNVHGFFAGHTHRNRVRRFPATGRVPHGEVSATKDYPGAWALYTLHEGGYIQELRRCTAPKALRWADRTKNMYFGLYRHYAIGTLAERCFSYRF